MPPCSGRRGLLGPLIDPGADKGDLLGFQRRDPSFIIWGRHVIIGISNVANIVHQHAVRTIAGFDNLAVLAAFERAFKAVEPQLGFWLLLAVALHTRLVE